MIVLLQSMMMLTTEGAALSIDSATLSIATLSIISAAPTTDNICSSQSAAQ